MPRMFQKVAYAFALGCLTGGGVVWLMSAGRAPDVPVATRQKPAAAAAAPSYAAPGPGTSSFDAAVAARPPGASTSPGAAGPAATPPADAAPPPGYDFGDVTRSEQRLEAIFRNERVDPAWAAQTVDSLNLVLSQMPERSVIGEYGLTCKASLCKLEIRGDPRLLAGNDPKNNVQPALMKMMAEPPASEMFDDDMMNVNIENDGLATITLYAHRRKPKR